MRPAGVIGFMYAVFEYAAVPHPLLTIVAQHHPQPWAPAVLDRLGLAYRQSRGTSTKAALGVTGPAPAQRTAAAELFRESGRGWSALADHAAQADPEADLRDWCEQAAELVEATLATEREATALLSAAVA
ncbi:hypothetical protein KIF24_11290 [Micromonospora sp. Llam7]|uniref:hypothetical protein n=1 Tax=Micromonospora tarapacensis TaxID=2835305 RepID=UPI001C82B896|nr:hypothetical protein [Micromonospora tarapacensis]MBX7266563.1 hypothetical protein [Micromonospora tarapacensis]